MKKLLLSTMVIGLLMGVTSLSYAQNLKAEYDALWPSNGGEPQIEGSSYPVPEKVAKVFNKYWSQIRIGMTDKQVIKLIGKPGSEELQINKTVTKWGVREQWVLHFWPMVTQYLYFENGVLTSWQQ